MIRTQIYLTPEESDGINKIAAETGENRSEVIRRAIDGHLEKFNTRSKLERLQASKGIWKDRDDLFDLAEERKNFDRYP